VQGLVQEILVQVVVDVLVAEATSGAAGALIAPVVVVITDMQVTKVDVAEGIVVADQARLPMVVEVIPRDRDPIRGADDVDLAVLGGREGWLVGYFW